MCFLSGVVPVARALVSIQVHDVNDHTPVFIYHTYNVTWSVGMATDALAVVKATDKDSGTCGRVLYTIVDGNEQRMFRIDLYSGTNYIISLLSIYFPRFPSEK